MYEIQDISFCLWDCRLMVIPIGYFQDDSGYSRKKDLWVWYIYLQWSHRNEVVALVPGKSSTHLPWISLCQHILMPCMFFSPPTGGMPRSCHQQGEASGRFAPWNLIFPKVGKDRLLTSMVLGASCTRWWFQIFFIFIPIWGRFPFWRAYFSNGLKPPTSVIWMFRKIQLRINGLLWIRDHQLDQLFTLTIGGKMKPFRTNIL